MGLLLALSVAFSGFSVSAKTISANDLVEGAKLCTAAMPAAEKKYGIPKHMLMAIGSTESGRYSDYLKMVVPWPWTINVEGKGYYFATKQEAMAAVQRHQSKGVKSIDIGCMQVNLKHHPKAFRSLSHAFDPATNVGYAAKFVRRNYDEAGQWTKAIGHYHSQTPSRSSKYLARVYQNWRKVLARGGETPSEMIQVAQTLAPAKTRNPKRISVASVLDADGATLKIKEREKPRMRVIKVYDHAPEMEVAMNYERDDHSGTMGFVSERSGKVVVLRPNAETEVTLEADNRSPNARPRKPSEGQFSPRRSYTTIGSNTSTATFVFNN